MYIIAIDYLLFALYNLSVPYFSTCSMVCEKSRCMIFQVWTRLHIGFPSLGFGIMDTLTFYLWIKNDVIITMGVYRWLRIMLFYLWEYAD